MATIAVASAITFAASAFAQESTATLVYESVAPAVVFVETDGGSGSGLLLASNTVLTGAHVVYPHRSARIVFPSGRQMLIRQVARNTATSRRHVCLSKSMATNRQVSSASRG